MDGAGTQWRTRSVHDVRGTLQYHVTPSSSTHAFQNAWVSEQLSSSSIVPFSESVSAVVEAFQNHQIIYVFVSVEDED
jgi:hypothetical protein